MLRQRCRARRRTQNGGAVDLGMFIKRQKLNVRIPRPPGGRSIGAAIAVALVDGECMEPLAILIGGAA